MSLHIASPDITRSPYLAAGVISARKCVRATLALSENRKPRVDATKDTGVGRWVQELGTHSSA